MQLRKFKKILAWFFLSLLFLVLAVWIFIQTPFGQNWIIGKVTHRLSKDLRTRIDIRRVDFSLFNKMHLQGTLVEDQKGDTLLYAGDLNVRLTDWFFFKKNIELKYVGLENAVIRISRNDSVWNHQFLIDYFSNPSASAKKESGGTQLNIKELDLKKIVFTQKDGWQGQDMTVSLASFHLNAKEVNFNSHTINLDALTMVDPAISLYNYPRLKPASIPVEKPKLMLLDSTLKWNAEGWIVKADRLDIENGTFKTNKYSTTAPLPGFDGSHIEFTGINTQLRNLKWEKDTITTHLNLQAKERSGFQVKNMVADLKLTPQEMAFDKLEIKTNNSTIRNYFRMSYDDISSMGNFIHAVKMQANFDDAEIDSDDIAYFAPAMKTWKKALRLKGTVRGTVDDLIGKDLVIMAGSNTLLNGDISMTGLPDINQTFIDFKANDFRTTFDDAAAFVPAIKTISQPNLRKLQYLRFTGSFTGFIRDFVTYGVMQTALGTLRSDINMKLPTGQPPVYSGTISTDYFRLGDLIGDSRIGAVAIDGSVKGKGFSEKDRHTDVDGKIAFVEYKNYRYTNLSLRGKLDRKRFEGIASIHDAEAELTLNGLIDFNSKTPTFNFLADVQKANLKKLNLTKDSLAFTGNLNLNFSGDNIDNFLGYANITQASLTRRGEPLSFDSLLISSEYINNEKILTARSNEFEAKVSGNFNIRDLPDAFKLFLNKYYPAYIRPPRSIPQNESLSFDITTHYVDEYVKLIDSSLSGFNNSHIYGDLNTTESQLNFKAEIPQFKYKQYNFDDVQLTAKGSRDSLALNGGASNIKISDSLNVPFALFRINAHNDSSQVNILTGANQAINRASINAEVLTYDNGVKIEFNPSTFIVNGKTWTIDDSGELEFRKNTPASGQLVLKESDQEIRVKTRPSETGDWNDLAVELKKINLGDFAPFILPKNRLEGLVSGNILIEDPVNNLFITTDDLKGEAIRLDNDSLGDIKAAITYDNKTKQLKGNGSTLNPDSNLAFDLNLSLGDDQEEIKKNLIALKAKNFQLSILERFLGTLFSDMQGYVTGDFDLRGAFNNLEVTGKGRLKDAGLKVNFTQCFYKIQDTDLELKPTEINLDGIILTDPVTGNPVYLTGNIQHNAFKNMFFGLTVSTLKPNTTGPENNKPVLLLNTNVNNNDQFYGRVKGTGSFSLSGYQSDLYMKIDAIASTRDSSSITIPSSKGRETGIADFLVEKKYGREMVDSSFRGDAANITYDVDLTANPKLTVKVILDDLTGDKIEGKGSGNLNIHSGTNEKMTMRGRFDIEEGNYLFTFQSFFKKPFEIRQGTENFISWTGDPLSAKIQFQAVYTAENVSFTPLANGLPGFQNYANLRENVYVVANLTGDLFKPDFKFSLAFPTNSKVNSDFTVATALDQMEKNPNEINRQVTYLIVFNSFAPPENATAIGFGSTINELTYNTISSISGLFFNEINKKLNSELSKILKTDNVSINFSGSVYNRNPLNQQNTGNFNINTSNFNVNVPISLFKDRFVVTLGSTLDVPLQATIQQNVQFLPDVTAEWLINQSGTIRASFFYRQNLDFLAITSSGPARTKRSGASIGYRKEFDTVQEFFGKKKKAKDQPKLPPPATLPSDTLKVEPVKTVTKE